MLSNLLKTSVLTDGLTIQGFLLCTVSALILGVMVTLIYMYKNDYSKNFTITLALLPAMVQVVILMVNGNLGTGVAVMGAFGLVRFRSIPGGAREIGSIFLAMAVGLATGMGYLMTAALLVVIVGGMNLILFSTPFGEGNGKERDLRVMIPEDLDYVGIFDDIFSQYTDRAALQLAKTTNMGSLYELQYQIRLKDEKKEKEMMDAMRCRNGNLTIVCGRVRKKEEL